jgi:hypothetical protein
VTFRPRDPEDDLKNVERDAHQTACDLRAAFLTYTSEPATPPAGDGWEAVRVGRPTHYVHRGINDLARRINRALGVMLLVLISGVVRGAEPGPVVTALRTGDPAPFAGVLVPAETLRALLVAQDERDEARELLAVERERRAADVTACDARLSAVEDARRACEASRVPPRRCDCAWSGWPWVSGAVGVVVGVGACAAWR